MHSLDLRIPQEVTENIIDRATQGGSLRCLKAFSLVSKAWLPRSRYHLFRRLRVFISTVDPDALENLLHVLQRDSGRGYRFSFLPAVEFVEELHVSDPFRTKAVEDGDGADAGHNVFSTLLAVLRMLPRVRVLNLDARIWLPDYQIPHITRIAPLTLARLGLGVDSDFRVALSLASSAKVLRITATMNMGQPSYPRGVPSRARLVPVDTLVLGSGVLRAEYVSAMRELGGVAAVAHLQVECDSMTDWGALVALLRSDAVSANLQSITLRGCGSSLRGEPVSCL